MVKKNITIKWLKEPEDHDYPAAKSYLSLIFEEPVAKEIVKKLKKTSISEFKAKDIFRASNLSLLGVSNTHVAKDQQKIEAGKEIAHLLLVRDSYHSKLIIADGYHRLCAIYTYDEDAIIPCKIV